TEIVEYVPDEKVVWVAHSKAGDIEVRYDFQETAQGTKVTHSLVSPAFDDEQAYQRSYRNNVRELANLKKLMEGGQ
ncbi:MAG: hypothetical protein HY675_15870, partial [Chloroflexi bacterium]|nr:hypothetical protein [Chloroflexota bacterium]